MKKTLAALLLLSVSALQAQTFPISSVEVDRSEINVKEINMTLTADSIDEIPFLNKVVIKGPRIVENTNYFGVETIPIHIGWIRNGESEMYEPSPGVLCNLFGYGEALAVKNPLRIVSGELYTVIIDGNISIRDYDRDFYTLSTLECELGSNN